MRNTNSDSDFIYSEDFIPEKEYKSSMGKFNYALRPAKNIERKMLCETFASLSCVSPIPKYRYIGFGSFEFVDFRLFHQRLGIYDMISIEREKNRKKQERVQCNLPYSCIQMEWGISNEILPTLDWNKRTIIWLDYDSVLNSEKLEDIRLVSGSLKSGSLLVVTVDSMPKNFENTTDDIHKTRYIELEKFVGKKKIPIHVKGKDLANWGLAEVSREIINNEIVQSLADRNSPLSTSSKISYKQLFNFHYDDGTKMLTVGGLFLNPTDQKKVDGDIFKHLDFIRADKSFYSIETPVLTLRELRLLDKCLPKSVIDSRINWIPKEERLKYKKIYRYFPNYTEVEA